MKSLTVKINYFTAFFWIALVGCDQPTTTSLVGGLYTFRYKSGQVETLRLDTNGRYEQAFYATNKDFDDKTPPTHTNSNAWSIKGDTVNLKHWLSICSYPNTEEILNTPQHLAFMEAEWVAPKGERAASLWLSQRELHYVLVREKEIVNQR